MFPHRELEDDEAAFLNSGFRKTPGASRSLNLNIPARMHDFFVFPSFDAFSKFELSW